MVIYFVAQQARQSAILTAVFKLLLFHKNLKTATLSPPVSGGETVADREQY